LSNPAAHFSDNAGTRRTHTHRVPVQRHAPEQQCHPHLGLHSQARLGTRRQVWAPRVSACISTARPARTVVRALPISRGEHRLPSLLHVREVEQHGGHALASVLDVQLVMKEIVMCFIFLSNLSTSAFSPKEASALSSGRPEARRSALAHRVGLPGSAAPAAPPRGRQAPWRRLQCGPLWHE
jgi:hypothetical protein